VGLRDRPAVRRIGLEFVPIAGFGAESRGPLVHYQREGFAYGDLINNLVTFVTPEAAVFFFVVLRTQWKRVHTKQRRLIALGMP
jgi:hypothetical protein